MVGFISNLAPLLNYLCRRSPAPPRSRPTPVRQGNGGAKIILCRPLYSYQCYNSRPNNLSKEIGLESDIKCDHK